LSKPDQRFQRSILLALRDEVRQRVAIQIRQRQQIGDECHILVGRRSASEQGLELLQPGRGPMVECEFGCTSELVCERKERAVTAIGRTEIAQADTGFEAEATF
jgi:hypothetical protein